MFSLELVFSFLFFLLECLSKLISHAAAVAATRMGPPLSLLSQSYFKAVNAFAVEYIFTALLDNKSATQGSPKGNQGTNNPKGSKGKKTRKGPKAPKT